MHLKFHSNTRNLRRQNNSLDKRNSLRLPLTFNVICSHWCLHSCSRQFSRHLMLVLAPLLALGVPNVQHEVSINGEIISLSTK